MDSSQLFGITNLLYLFSTMCYVGFLVFRNDKVAKIGFYLAALGVIAITSGIAMRWYESYAMGIGRAPMTNIFESIIFFAWATIFFYVILEVKYKIRAAGVFIMPLGLLAITYASFGPGMNQAITPLIPALQSNWLIAHVLTCFIGYAGFAMAFVLGIMYLLKRRSIKKIEANLQGQTIEDNQDSHFLPSLKIIDNLIYKSIIFGFIWLTAGIITGSIWANEAWGTYWSWDPKETWSAITWFIYAAAIHCRLTRGWSGHRIAWLAILGFCSVLFTWFGVNYLLSGLHSYG